MALGRPGPGDDGHLEVVLEEEPVLEGIQEEGRGRGGGKPVREGHGGQGAHHLLRTVGLYPEAFAQQAAGREDLARLSAITAGQPPGSSPP
ncbi:hypothetical protein STIAU_7789 [Stigmatella aurantiaca DW4/3-1]|uniref:Uncharacterized protein n=1 Tax=Stigmatella aurantiaca (strain DW4/3-1) TaxID=378806 RepID=Q08RT1_STIAD|nr:hypothetical protein STIAU_7789 [Stigmatella aurantiaca DW4/3-1]